MATLVSTICEKCLQSVEITRRSPSQTKGVCPVCRASVDIGSSVADDPTGEFSPSISEEDTTEYRPKGRGKAVNAWSTVAEVNAVFIGQIGRFKLKKYLGGGGYGDVFLAHDDRCKRFVALKVLRDEKVDERRRRRFEDEALAAAKLSHEGIVRLFDRGFDDGKLWIAYELVRGPSLAEEMKTRRFTYDEAAALVLHVARALCYVHSKQLTHRDVKPANILLGEHGRPVLTDLGLAKRMDIEGGITESSSVIGSRDYMSPEQAAGLSRLVDGRSDVYSLGVILFELLTGRLPSDRSEAGPVDAPRKSLDRITPRGLDPTIPEELDRICAQATELDLKKRFASMVRFADRLEAWLKARGKFGRSPIRVSGQVVYAGAAALGLAAGAFGLKLAIDALAPPASFELAAIGPKQPRPAPSRPEPSFFGNPNSHTVHHKSCPHLKNMTTEPVSFMNLLAATKQAYKNCSTCHPEQRSGDGK